MFYTHQTVDPAELETKLSTEEGVCWLDFLVDDEPAEDTQEKLERIHVLLEELPPVEADFIDLYYFKRKKQTDIANMFGVSQPTVCYRLQRAASRIQFLLSLPCVSEDEIEEDMRKFLTEEIDVKIMVQMFRTTCQSEVAKRLDVSQGMVRHRFIRAIRKMRDAHMYDKGHRFKIFIPKEDDFSYAETSEDAQVVLQEALDDVDGQDSGKEPKILEVPVLDASVGRFYEMYEQISANLTILRDVRRKTEDEVQLIVW